MEELINPNFNCSTCDLKFIVPALLELHQAECQGKPFIEQNFYDMLIITKDNLYECPICHLITSSREFGATHLKSCEAESFENPSVLADVGLNFCHLCYSVVSQFSFHLQMHHGDNPEVIRMKILPTHSLLRIKLTNALWKTGLDEFSNQFWTNVGLLTDGFDPKLQPMELSDVLKIAMAEHSYNLPEQKLIKSCVMLKNEVFPLLPNDDVSNIVKSDPLILILGNAFCLVKYSMRKMKWFNLIKTYLRYLGNWLLHAKMIDKSIVSLSDLLNISKWEVFLDIARKILVFDDNKEIPYLTKIRIAKFIFKLIANLFSGDNSYSGITQNHSINIWFRYFNKNFNTSILGDDTDHSDILQLVSDTTNLDRYLTDTMRECAAVLKIRFDFTSWTTLNRCCMINILLCNEQHVAVETIRLSDYLKKRRYKNLSVKEFKQVDVNCKIFNPFKFIFVKSGNNFMPLLVRRSICKYIDLLIGYRKEANVHTDNVFLFGSGSLYFTLPLTFRLISTKCDAVNPSGLRSLALRKQVSKIFQTLDMTDSEIDKLAQLFGVEIRIKSTSLKNPNEALLVAKISRLLEFVQCPNKCPLLQGTSLDNNNLILSCDSH